MQKKYKIKAAFIIFGIICLSFFMVNTYLPKEEANAFTSQVLTRGSTGQDVKELQGRLKYIGFFKGKVDGVFGWGTYWSLRNFQKEFGMKVDGVAGTKLKERLVKATKNYKASSDSASKSNSSKSSNKKQVTNAPNGYTNNDIKLMANAVYGESRGEPYIGQVAVAAVILNRLTSSSFPNSVSGIIYQPGAFTAVADGQINLTPNENAKKAVLDAINGWDPTTGCIYYYNPKTATNKWIRKRPKILTIGEHIFCK